jgi:lysine 6-dehydrogenase
MAAHAVVLGCGMVGATIARDVATDPDFSVSAIDVDAARLKTLDGIPRVQPQRVDLSDPSRLREAISRADVVLGALPSRFGFQTLKTVIEAGRPCADISFMPEDVMKLDALAREKNVTAIVDCGVSPGLSNFFVGRSYAELERTDRAAIYVGGLPRERRWPFEYKAPFSPYDVLEEYTRPSRLVENGRLVVRPALSEPELMDFPGVGTLEGFNTDGLRTLLATVSIPFMKEKTLRYPGHAELMRVFRETGLFSETPVEIRGAKVIPRELTSRLLFPLWTGQDGETEFTVLRVVVEGTDAGESVRHEYDLFDETDLATGQSSMARTTGFPCAVFGRMLARREFADPGVFPPELLARDVLVFDHVIHALRHRSVQIRVTRQTLGNAEPA